METSPNALRSELAYCLSRDRHGLLKAINRLPASERGAAEGEAFQRLLDRINRSREKVRARSERVPPLDYPDLPVSLRRSEILEAIREHQVVVICGETGSGKTTQLPKICLEAGRGRFGLIGHTQPRRLAARTVALRVAEELGTSLGQAVGFKVRFNDRTSPEGFIKVMTDGILLAEIQQDRYLSDYDTLIIDEAHERSLNIDFLLGYLKWLLPKRSDLKLIITSATIDPARFASHFGGAPIIEVSGRTHPVEIRYRPLELPEADETDKLEQKAILDAVDELWNDLPGDVLVFLSGEREIRETTDYLQRHLPKTVEVLPLFSRLSERDQERIFHPTNTRRVILATNVAETSLTVPGIRTVIDSGLARISRYSHRSKLQRLPVERISRASANQRSGRCGRLGPGIAIRLYTEADFLGREQFTDPEILRTNLAAVILQMQALKLGDIRHFPFIERPDERLVRDGLRTLQELNAVDAGGHITQLGQRLSRFPMDPRLARMLLAAHEGQCLRELAIIVSALSIQDPRDRPPEQSQQADQQHALFRDAKSDFIFFLNLWRAYEDARSSHSKSALRTWCRRHFLSSARMREWHDTHCQILEIIKGDLGWSLNEVAASYAEIHCALLAGLLSQVACRAEQGDYLATRGHRLHIHPGSFLFKLKPKWILSAEQVETSKVYARTVAAIEPEWIEVVGRHLIKFQHYDPCWERKSGRVVIHERTQLFGLTVQAGRRIPCERVSPEQARELFIRHALVSMEFDTQAPFFIHNKQLLEDADYLQQKGRRVDLMVDEAWLQAFYDQRLPKDIHGGVSFDRWRKAAEAQDPSLLFLTRDMIIRPVEKPFGRTEFPDQIDVGPLKLALSYRFEPGHPEDGVSVKVPLQLLNGLQGVAFRWLVPGLFRERVTALLKSLPKTLRIHFVPIPDYVDRILPMLDFGEGDLYEALSKALKKTGGIQVPISAFREEVIPDHLKINFQILGPDQNVIDSGRDLASIKQRHAVSAEARFVAIAREVCLTTGLRDWPETGVPEVFEGMDEGRRVFGFPALVDEGETVAVRLFETLQDAEMRHETGVARLISLSLTKDLKSIRKAFSLGAEFELQYGRLPLRPQGRDEMKAQRTLVDDLVIGLLAATFLQGHPPVRSRSDMEKRLDAHRRSLYVNMESFLEVARKLSSLLKEINQRLEGPLDPNVKRDVTRQLAFLVFRGFWVQCPWSSLKDYPRYLSAVLYRLQKANEDPSRDARLRAELEPIQQALWDALERARGILIPERESCRWALEELRVSLFAQQLKTAYPISVKRMRESLKSLESTGSLGVR